MIINRYLADLVEALKTGFGDEFLYAGLQGSYLRGEATDQSDIDIMIVFDHVDVKVLKTYRDILMDLGNYEKSCGFVCGREDLLNWNPQEICHVLNSTSDLYGKLKDLVPEFSRKDIADYIKINTGNLYHALCHRFIHSGTEKSIIKLPLAKRDIFFILQNLSYLETGHFICKKSDVSSSVKGLDLEVWKRLDDVSEDNFDQAFDLVLLWCSDVLRRTAL